MRVTFLTQWFDPEPGALRGLPLARRLVKRGVEVEVVTGFPNYPGGRVYDGYRIRHWQRETVSDVPVLRVPLFPSHGRSVLGRIANYGSFALSSGLLGPLLTHSSDVLYVYHPPPTVGLAAATFRRLRKVPIVYHIADMWPESVVESGMLGDGRVRHLANDVLGAYCKWVYAEATAITVLSPGFKRLLVERGVPDEKVHVIYNWADDDVFRPVPRDEALARDLGLAGKTNIVYAGNLGSVQGLATVIRAAAKLRHIPDLQVVFVGTGVEEESLQSLARELGAGNVVFLGRRQVAEMPTLNALADALVVHLKDLPVFRATIPSKTQVSLASGRPIIMAVAGDAADVVRAAGAGWVVPPQDEDALASAMLSVHGTPAHEREKLGKRGRDYYMREMSLEVGTDRMEELLRDVAEQPRKAGRPAA